MKKSILLLLFLIVLVSCGSPYEDNTNIVDTLIIMNYLNKANGFLLCIMYLLESEKKYWLNVYSRLYYFYFTLARIKSILQQNNILKNNHEEIWQLNKKRPRKIFGKEFKEIRAGSDYNIIDNINSFIKSTNKEIINSHKAALDEQILDIIDYTKRYEDVDIDSVNQKISEIKNNYTQIIEIIKKNNK
jgi:DNA-binding transcriptional MerR regulator